MTNENDKVIQELLSKFGFLLFSYDPGKYTITEWTWVNPSKPEKDDE